MKILMVDKYLFPKGGAETYMFSLVDYLSKKGHQVQFFGMYDERNIVAIAQNKLVKTLDFHTKSWARFLYPFKVIYSYEARQKIAVLLDEFKPDIVHLNTYNYQLTPSIIYEVKKHQIPIVQTVHDPQVICPSHMLYNIQSGEICEKCKKGKYLNCIKTKCIHGSRVKSILGAFEGYLYNKLKAYDYIKTLICPSRFIGDKLIEFGFNRNKIIVLHNFVTQIEPTNSIVKKDFFLYFGRISPEKGVNILLKAIEKLPGIKFCFAGQGSLESILSNYPNIEYVGFKQGEELMNLIRQSKATILPSVWYENCPMSILESLNLGTPVIGSEIGGIPELVNNQVGLLFNPGDADDLAKKIQFLNDNKEKVEELSVNSIFYAQKYSINSYYDKLINIYEEAMRNNNISVTETISSVQVP
jgi:glycosyltransferase involved in cell wall biosynthesis